MKLCTHQKRLLTKCKRFSSVAALASFQFYWSSTVAVAKGLHMYVATRNFERFSIYKMSLTERKHHCTFKFFKKTKIEQPTAGEVIRINSHYLPKPFFSLSFASLLNQHFIIEENASLPLYAVK